jgi:preprotein translocase subunit SecF
MFQAQATEFFGWLRPFLTSTFDWFFLSAGNIFVLFCLLLLVTPLGKVRLGGADAKPDYTYMGWFAMLFAAGMGILLTLALISGLQLEVALPTVAAVLTIVGYSLNDTIVIFDRIRENLKIGGRRADFTGTLNKSINETLPRTVVTSATTLVTLLALFLFGGSVIRDFTLIMIFGIVLGTYSSIFVASPALLMIENKWPGDRKKARVPRAAKAAV